MNSEQGCVCCWSFVYNKEKKKKKGVFSNLQIHGLWGNLGHLWEQTELLIEKVVRRGL